MIRVHCCEEYDFLPVCGLGLHPDLVDTFVELGLLRVEGDRVRADELLRLKKMLRLKRTLAVNLAGAAIIVDLLARIEQLEDEIVRLRRGQVR